MILLDFLCSSTFAKGDVYMIIVRDMILRDMRIWEFACQ